MLFYVMFFIVVCTSAQFVNSDICPDAETKSSFDVNRYMGKWYVFARGVPKDSIIPRHICVTLNFSVADDGVIEVVRRDLFTNGSEWYSLRGEAVVNTDDLENVVRCAKLKVKMTIPGILFNTVNYRSSVLETDYTSYSVVQNIVNLPDYPNQTYYWVFARKPNPPQSVLDRADRIMSQNGFNDTFFNKIDLSYCIHS